MTVTPTGLGAASLLAHQGGWDEILMVLTPIALFAALLWLANSRATRLQDQRTTSSPDASSTTDSGPTDDPAPTGDTGAPHDASTPIAPADTSGEDQDPPGAATPR